MQALRRFALSPKGRLEVMMVRTFICLKNHVGEVVSVKLMCSFREKF
jgi:hypothetical protein